MHLSVSHILLMIDISHIKNPKIWSYIKIKNILVIFTIFVNKLKRRLNGNGILIPKLHFYELVRKKINVILKQKLFLCCFKYTFSGSGNISKTLGQSACMRSTPFSGKSHLTYLELNLIKLYTI